jgi:hypothetical protein
MRRVYKGEKDKSFKTATEAADEDAPEATVDKKII